MSKSVIFDETVLIKRIRSIEEALEDEETWYTAEDFHKIRQRERKLAISISKAALSSSSSKNKNHNQSSSSSFHGIETTQQKEVRRKRMSEATYSVLCEQEEIWDEDPDTPIGGPPASARIRLAIEQYSYDALEDATSRAMQNAEDVLQVYCNFDTVAGGQRLRLPRRRRSSSTSERGGAGAGNGNNNNNSSNNNGNTTSSRDPEDNNTSGTNGGGSTTSPSSRWQSFSSSSPPPNNSGSSGNNGSGSSPGGIQLSSRSSKRQLLKGVFQRGRS